MLFEDEIGRGKETDEEKRGENVAADFRSLGLKLNHNFLLCILYFYIG